MAKQKSINSVNNSKFYILGAASGIGAGLGLGIVLTICFAFFLYKSFYLFIMQ